ncbi:MAG: glycosyltransferase [Planctomycetia bacterium]|nr:glycosyltransferase [Planctomycetia bacterium]
MRRLTNEGRLRAVLNGIDLDRWNIAGLNYHDKADAVEGVLRAKESLRRQLYGAWQWNAGPEPVIAVRSRWDEEKGVELIGECIERVLTKARVIMRMWKTSEASSNLRGLWMWFQTLAEKMPDRFLFNPPHINTIVDTAVHYTICDFLLMPSRCEPCGLAQMECQRYGTIPIVRQIGGLADTVSENGHPGLPSPNGFPFAEMTSESLLRALERAIKAFHDMSVRRQLIGNALRQQNGWDSRVAEYEALLSG